MNKLKYPLAQILAHNFTLSYSKIPEYSHLSYEQLYNRFYSRLLKKNKETLIKIENGFKELKKREEIYYNQEENKFEFSKKKNLTTEKAFEDLARICEQFNYRDKNKFPADPALINLVLLIEHNLDFFKRTNQERYNEYNKNYAYLKEQYPLLKKLF